ncbi:MAG: M48 family metalloprotease [Nitrospinae bacterium]|nr:M48 family metalloprotease [Nitrospinota bacterium]
MRNAMTRRGFLATGALAASYAAKGCATNPVTGQTQLMMISEQQEVTLDRKNSPHQFSADYGIATDNRLNGYLNTVGRELTSRSHRPAVPYSFQMVNATYVNAYAFPGGSIAATRGILLELNNEAELAALLGHEIGHVNARHTAARMSTMMLAQLAVAGLAVAAAARDESLGSVAAGLGGIGAGLLLASYSRDDERQADALGMEYMTRAGYDPRGMAGLMEVLRSMHKEKPSALETMFATHPMSDERYATAVRRADTEYASSLGLPMNRERYMDETARLRAMRPAVEKMQNGERLMMKEKPREAEGEYEAALKLTPADYAGLLMMAKCQLVQEKFAKAEEYARRASEAYPGEAQAKSVLGMANLRQKKYAKAHENFAEYESMLPGNPNTIFYKGYSLEGMGDRQRSAKEYYRYLQADRQSKQAQYAYQRLVEWGYIQPEKQEGKK